MCLINLARAYYTFFTILLELLRHLSALGKSVFTQAVVDLGPAAVRLENSRRQVCRFSFT